MRSGFRDGVIEGKKTYAKDTFLIVGDIGFGVFESFQSSFPEDYLNIGICEANMIGFASGMASTGNAPIVYTIVPFLVMRPFEQIRIDLALENRKVMLVGVGGGLAYGALGPTHHSFEDLALMCLLPNFHVFSPSQPSDGYRVHKIAYQHDGPSYIRLGKNGEPELSNQAFKTAELFSIYGDDPRVAEATIITYGALTSECVKAAKALCANGIKTSVISLLRLKPIPFDAFEDINPTTVLFFVEEHTTVLSPLTHIQSALSAAGKTHQYVHLGIQDKFTREVGSRDVLLTLHGLAADQIENTVAHRLNG